MADIKQLDTRYSVSVQMTVEDFDIAKDMGATHIISNRVEGEEPGQPSDLSMADEAQQRGMTWLGLPMGATQFPMNEVTELTKLLKDENIIIHAYCKSGMRSVALWAFATALNKSMTPDDIIAQVQSIGFDPSPFAAAVAHLYEADYSD